MTDKKIFIVDDDEAVRDSLGLLMRIKGFLVETYASAEAFLGYITAAPSGGCVIADVRMSGMNGIQMLIEMRKAAIDLPVVVITGHGDVPMAVAALKAGAVDFIEKPYENAVLLNLVRKAVEERGGTRFDMALVYQLIERRNQLSERERQVLDLVVAGQPNKVIANELGISTRTVEIHRAHMMEKMQARTLSDLIRSTTIIEIGESVAVDPHAVS